MHKCSHRRCHVPDTSCYLGELTPQNCPEWKKGDAEAPAEISQDGRDSLLPWSGSAMGTRDLAFLTGRGEAKLVAIIGPHNAGKTTLLAAWYQHVGRTGRAAGQLFAGSYTLSGWEAVGHSLRWEGGAPKFPPHTASTAGRAPGMLHLALRSGTIGDYLFADSPGEWFQRWAVDQTAPDAEGARWLTARAACLVVIADCEALAGPQRGNARADLQQLLRRTALVREGRPVALAWTKADVQISDVIRQAVREAALRAMPDIVEFHVSVAQFEIDGKQMDPGEALSDLLAWVLQPVKRGFPVHAKRSASDDPFFLIGEGA